MTSAQPTTHEDIPMHEPITLVSDDDTPRPPVFATVRGRMRDCLIRGRGHQLTLEPRHAFRVDELRLGACTASVRVVRSTPSGGGGWRVTLELRLGAARPLVAFLGRWCRTGRTGVTLGDLPGGISAWAFGWTRALDTLPVVG